MSETLETLNCDRCGEACKDGKIERYFGQADAETGYQESEMVCSQCWFGCSECGAIEGEPFPEEKLCSECRIERGLDKADYDEETEERYAEGDRQFTAEYEECGF